MRKKERHRGYFDTEQMCSSRWWEDGNAYKQSCKGRAACKRSQLGG